MWFRKCLEHMWGRLIRKQRLTWWRSQASTKAAFDSDDTRGDGEGLGSATGCDSQGGNWGRRDVVNAYSGGRNMRVVVGFPAMNRVA